jgi:two-component system chemotaxis response regulator CheY
MRNLQKGVLTQLGYSQIEEACDGLDALAKATASQPDLILLDWNMPNMDGLQFVEKYRAQSGKAPIMMVTTEAEKTRVITAIKAGVNNYVIKPFTPEVLAERIRETLDKAA